MPTTSIQAQSGNKGDVRSKGLASPTLEDLLRLLVGRATNHNLRAHQLGQQSDLEEIVIDTEVDGARYLLVRMPRSGRPQISLSPREQEIVRLVAQGHPNKVIADVLSISSWTVCTHLRRIFAKLQVGTRAAMIARVSEIGRPHVSPPHPGATAPPRIERISP